MHKKEKTSCLGRDERMDSIGIPINPHRQKQPAKSEFWTDLLDIFVGTNDVIGVFSAIILAILFTIKWTFYLIEKYVFRVDAKKPIVKKKA